MPRRPPGEAAAVEATAADRGRGDGGVGHLRAWKGQMQQTTHGKIDMRRLSVATDWGRAPR